MGEPENCSFDFDFFFQANNGINYILILEFSRPNRRGKFVCFGGFTSGVDLTRSSSSPLAECHLNFVTHIIGFIRMVSYELFVLVEMETTQQNTCSH